MGGFPSGTNEGFLGELGWGLSWRWRDKHLQPPGLSQGACPQTAGIWVPIPNIAVELHPISRLEVSWVSIFSLK